MIIGASNDPAKFGNKAVRAYVRKGHTVFPVNPRETTIEDLKCYHSVAEVPGPIDRAAFYVPPEVGMLAMIDIGQREDVAEVWLNPGSESEEVLDAADALDIKPIQACAIIDIGEKP